MSTPFAFDGLPVPDVRTPLPGPRAAALLARDAEFVSPSYTRVYPLVVERGSGCVVEDVDGNRFLDFTAGIAVTATGHCHPEVVAAVHDQADKLLHMSGTDFYYRPQIDLAERLAKVAPGPSPKKVFFTNSGAEAVEAALKLSRWHTRRNRVVSFFGAFHGRTYGAMSLSGSKLVHRRGFSPLVPDIHHVEFPRTCSTGCGDGRCGLVEDIHETIFRRTCPPEEVAAIFLEPIQGEGGYHPLPPGCLPAVRAMCDRHGILLVADEVQSGMGRTGKMFACEHYGVEPDILCTAKGIASGMPLGAIVARADVMDWPSGSHASTFGGNPVSCRAALATIDLLEREYVTNAAARGEQLRAGLRALAERVPGLANVRGLGQMTAVDVTGAGGREAVIQHCFQRGLLLLGCGEAGIRFCPPLCVTAAQVETALALLVEVLDEASRGRRFPFKRPRADAMPHRRPLPTGPPMQPPPPNVALFQLIAGKWVAQALSVVARFRVADHLAAGPKTAAELASLTGTHAGHLYRILRAVAAVGVLDQSADGRFSLTPVGEFLRGDVPGSMRAVATYCCDSWSWKPWGDLAETVRTGAPAFDRMFGEGVFDYLSKHPDEFATFNEGMTGFSAAESAAAVKVYDFSRYSTIADVGGGYGHLLTTILKAAPNSRGVVFDLPGVVEGAVPTITAAGLTDRCTTQRGSFFETAPAADLHVMKHIIHDWNDEKATQILRSCRKAVRPGGKLVLIEMVIPAQGGDPAGKLLDLEMMVLCDGKERTEAEYAALLAGAAYRLTKVVPTESPACVVEAEPV